MGQLHNELTRGPWSRALKNALGVAKGEGGIERYGETLTPTADLWALPEWAFLRNERLVAISRSGAAVAAEFATVALLNPGTSQSLVTVEDCSLDAGGLAASTVMIVSLVTEAVITATIGTPASGIGRDSRFIGGGVTIGQTLSGTDPAAIGSTIESVRMPAGNMCNARSTPFVLGPGFALVVQLGTVNTAMIVNWKWRERKAFPGEL